MKFCPKCGKEISEDIKYCPGCGAEQQMVEKPVVSIQETLSQKAAKLESSETYRQTQEKVGQFSKESKNYFGFLVSAVKNPDLKKVSGIAYFGLVSFLIVTLFLALAISRSLVSMGLSVDGKAFPMIMELFLWIALSAFVKVAIVFGYNRFIAKQEVTLLNAFEKVFSPISVTVFASLAAFVLSFAITGLTNDFIFKIFFFLVIAIFFLIDFSYLGNLWVTDLNQTNKNKVYMVLLALVVGMLLQYLLARIFGQVFANQLATMIERMVTNTFGGMLNMFN